MWPSTDTSNASADDELVAEEEDYDDEYDHDCRAQHVDHGGDCPPHPLDGCRLPDPEDIPIPFSYGSEHLCEGCYHDDERKVCRSCESPDLFEFGLCFDCVVLADISEFCMFCTNLRLGHDDDRSEEPHVGYSPMCRDCLYRRCCPLDNDCYAGFFHICPRCTGTSGLCKGCMPLLHYDNDALYGQAQEAGLCSGTLHTTHPPSTSIVHNCQLLSSLCRVCQFGALQQYDLCWACGQAPPVLGGLHF